MRRRKRSWRCTNNFVIPSLVKGSDMWVKHTGEILPHASALVERRYNYDLTPSAA
jgi:hypothetical protein